MIYCRAILTNRVIDHVGDALPGTIKFNPRIHKPGIGLEGNSWIETFLDDLVFEDHLVIVMHDMPEEGGSAEDHKRDGQERQVVPKLERLNLLFGGRGFLLFNSHIAGSTRMLEGIPGRGYAMTMI